MKMQCTVRFNFTISGNEIVGGFDPEMGHSSSLSIDGEKILRQTRDGLLCAPLKAFKVGAAIETGTNKSRFVGQILSIQAEGESEPERLTVLAVGEFSGTQGSIMGGTSCHCGWKIVAVSAVSGRFGTFEIHGGDPLARYNHARDTHRAKFYSVRENSWGGLEPVWTPLASRLAKELGHQLMDGIMEVRVDKPDYIDCLSPAYWADNCEEWLEEKQRLARLARVKRLTKNVPPNVRDVRFQDRNGKLRWDYVTA